MAEERIKGLSIGLDLDTVQLERGLTGLKDRLKTVDSAMKANLSSFDRGERSVEKYESTLQGLNAKLNIHRQALSATEDEMKQAIRTYGEGSRQAEAATRSYNAQVTAINTLERRIGGLKTAMNQLKSEQAEANSLAGKLKATFSDLGETVKGVGDQMAGIGTGMTMALTVPLAGAGVGILGLAKNYDDAAVQMQNAMGLTEKETAKLTKTAQGIYEKGYGESLEEVEKGITQTRMNIKGLNDEDLMGVTKKAMILGKTFEADVNEVTRAGGNVMKGFGIDSERAFDLMGWGAQKGLNFSNEMFDNLSEYAPLYKNMGFSAEEYFQLLANGAESGVYNLDYINDAMKEFQIRIKDSSDTTNDAMSEMSKETQATWQSFLSGKSTVKEVHNAVLGDLKGMDDQVKANNLGVSLYGTKWEDLESDSMYALGNIDGKLKGVDGTMDDMTKNLEESFGARLKGTLREAGDAFLPLGNQLLDVAETVLPKVSGAIKGVTSFLEGMSPAGKTATLIFAGIAAAIPPVLAVIGVLIGAFGNIIGALAPVVSYVSKAGGLLNVLRTAFLAINPPVAITIGALTALGVGFVALYKKSETFRGFIDGLVGKVKELGQSMMNGLKSALETVKSFLSQQIGVLKKFWEDNSSTIIAAAQNIGKVVSAVFTAIGKVISFVMPAVLAIIKSVWGNIKGVISGALNVIMGLVKIFSGLFAGNFSKMWEGIKQVFSGAVQFLWNFIQLQMFGKLLSLGKIFITSFKGVFTSMWTALKGIFTKGAGAAKDGVIAAWNLLKSITTGIFNAYKNLLLTVWNFLKSMITKAAQFILNGVKNSFNLLKSATTSIFNAVRNFLSGLWSGLREMITKAAQAIFNAVRNSWTTLKNTTTNLFNGIKDFLSRMWTGTRNTVTNLAGRIKDGVINAWNTLSSKTSSLFTGIKDKVKGIFDDMVDFAKKLPKRIGDGIGSMANKVKDGVKAVGNKLAGQLETVVNAITQKGINVVLDKIGVGKKGKIPPLDLPEYARGTGAGGHKGGLFVAGDGGENELIRFPDGRMVMSPNTDTLYYGEKGTQVLNGKQTKQALGVLGDVPMYNKGTDWLKNGADVAKGWAVSAWNKSKDVAKSVGDAVGDVWSYASNPKKLMNKVWDTLNLPTIDAGGTLAQFAIKGVSKIKDGAVDFVKKKFDEFMPEMGGSFSGGTGSIGGSGVQRWRPYIVRAAAQMKENITESDIIGILAQIKRESGGNDKITQSSAVWDINTANGNPARGLLQYIPQTFRAYAMKGHGNIYSGYDQLLAFFNNTTWRRDNPRGTRGWGPRGKRKYKNGTDYHIGGDAILGDGGNYEPFLLPNGNLGLSPNVSTMFKDLPAGTKVWKDAQAFAKSIASTQSRTELSQLVALIGKQIAEAKQRKEKSNSSNNQTVKQEINIENKVTIQVAGVLDRETLLKLADQLEEILDDKTTAKLRSEGGYILG
jgi:phage-related minor tail protein/SLT domain-containing protein